MREPYTHPFPVLAILLAVACLGVPTRAVAQTPHDYCYQCNEWKEDPEYVTCEPVTKEGTYGHLSCTLMEGAKQCGVSTGPRGGHDCIVVPTLDGRASLGVDSEPWPQAVGGTELPRWVLHAVPAVLLEVARRGCTGAIIQRRYSSPGIAELRSDLERVAI